MASGYMRRSDSSIAAPSRCLLVRMPALCPSLGRDPLSQPADERENEPSDWELIKASLRTGREYVTNVWNRLQAEENGSDSLDTVSYMQDCADMFNPVVTPANQHVPRCKQGYPWANYSFFLIILLNSYRKFKEKRIISPGLKQGMCQLWAR